MLYISDCGKPAPIPYGSVVVNEEEGTKYGSKATVVCPRGYTSSKPEATCQANGKWSSVYCHVTGKLLLHVHVNVYYVLI